MSGQFAYTYDETAITSFNGAALQGLSVPPPAVGAVLPGTPKTSLVAALEYGHVPLGAGELRYAVNARYQSAIVPALSATIPTAPGYTMLDLRASYSVAHWLASVYAENVTNKIGVNSYSDPFNYGAHYEAMISRPRTIGISVAYSFAER